MSESEEQIIEFEVQRDDKTASCVTMPVQASIKAFRSKSELLLPTNSQNFLFLAEEY